MNNDKNINGITFPGPLENTIAILDQYNKIQEKESTTIVVEEKVKKYDLIPITGENGVTLYLLSERPPELIEAYESKDENVSEHKEVIEKPTDTICVATEDIFSVLRPRREVKYVQKNNFKDSLSLGRPNKTFFMD